MGMIINPYSFAGLDAITVAWLARLTTLYGTNPSTSYITALNTLISTIRSKGYLSMIDLLVIFAQEVQGYARVPVISTNSNTVTEVNSPVFTVNNGYTGNGATRYLNMNWNYSTHAVSTLRNSLTHSVYITTNVAEAKFDAGVLKTAGGTTDILMASRWSDGRAYGGANNSTGEANAVIANSLGMTTAQRTSTAAGGKVYRNSTLLATLVDADNALPNLVDYSMCMNNAGAAANLMSKRISMRMIGGGGIPVSDWYTDFQAFATSIGFNV